MSSGTIEVVTETTSVEVVHGAPVSIELYTVPPVSVEIATSGLQGAVGPPSSLALGTVETLDTGRPAYVTITGAAPNQIVNFGLPRGLVGQTGPANQLTLGTVATGAPGSTAIVEITGTSPNQVLNLTLPRGDTGAQGIQGTQGVQGIQGTQGIQGPVGPAGLEWRGNWSSTVDYIADDAVYHNFSSWFASVDPPVGEVPSDASTFWQPLAARGAQGVQGEQGIQGVQGIQGIAGLNWRGAWAATTAYGVNDAVTYGGSSYRRLVAGTTTGTPTADTTNWDVIALAGSGTVQSVNTVVPDGAGNVTLTAANVGAVATTGSETIAGIKTFSSSPVVPDASFTVAKTTGLQAALDTKVTGPVSSTDFRIAVFDGITGKVIKEATNTVAGVLSRANHTGTQAQSTIVNLTTDLAAKAPLDSPTFTGIVSGITATMVGLGNVPNIDTTNASNITSGVLSNAVLPALAISETYTVATQAAMLALTAQRGDVAIRTDLNKTFILSTDSPSMLADWKELLTPTDAVTSVAGKVGVVTLIKDDVGLGNVDNTADTAKPVSTAQQSALDLKANLASPTFTGIVGGITATMVGLGNVANTAQVDLTSAQTIGGAKTFSVKPVMSAGITVAGGNDIVMGALGAAAPTFTTRSAGTKIVLYEGVTSSATDYALGIENSTLWFSTSATTTQFKWYGGTTLAATLTGTGNLSTVGTITAAGTGFSGPGVNISTLNATNLTTGTIADARLPARIGARGNVSAFGGDWNLAREPGYYSSDTATNAPGTGWYLVHVETHDNTGTNLWVTQTAHAFAASDGAADTKLWRRSCDSGTWSAWYRLRWSETELDTRYMLRTKGGYEVAAQASGTTGNIYCDVNLASVFTVVPTGNITINITNASGGGSAGTYTIIVRQGTTAYSVSMGTVKWMGSQPTQTANKDTVYTFVRVHDGPTENWYVSAVVTT